MVATHGINSSKLCIYLSYHVDLPHVLTTWEEESCSTETDVKAKLKIIVIPDDHTCSILTHKHILQLGHQFSTLNNQIVQINLYHSKGVNLYNKKCLQF